MKSNLFYRLRSLVALAALVAVFFGYSQNARGALAGCALFTSEPVLITDFADRAETKEGVRVWDAALKAAFAKSRTVRFPKGDYPFAETIRLDSDSRIEADPGATIGHAPFFDGLLVRNVPGAKGIAIAGGVWYDHRRDPKKYGNYRARVGDNSQMFRFLNACDVTVRDICVSNAPTFSFQAGGVTNLVVENFRIVNGGADGVHLNGGIRHALVRNVCGNTGDDIVALNAWDWKKSTECFGPSSDVVIDNVSGGYGAIRLLPGQVCEKVGGPWLDCSISRVTVRNCKGLVCVKGFYQYDPFGGKPARMGRFEDLLFENLSLDLVQSFSESPKAAGRNGRGHFGAFDFCSEAKNIVFRNVTVNFHADKMPTGHFFCSGPWGWAESASPTVTGVRFENCRATGVLPTEMVCARRSDPSCAKDSLKGIGTIKDVTGEVQTDSGIKNAAAPSGAVDASGEVKVARYPSAEAQRFRIEKLGTLALDRVETNPVVYRGKPYIFEFDRKSWSGGWFRSLDNLKEKTPKFGEGLAFACAFADGDRIAVTGSAGGTDTWSRCEIRMTESTDMVNWTKPRCILRKEGWAVFNTSVCKADGRYVMVFERGDPGDEVGEKFTMFFAESEDFEAWRQVPGARFGSAFYTGSPCLKYHDGWFYFFYLAHAGQDAKGKDLWRMRVVRSQTLADGSWQFGNRDVLGFDEADRKPYPGVWFDAKALKRLATAEDRNVSDIDMTDVRGDLVITYSWGNQEGVEHQALARIRNCTEADFCKSFFK